MKLDSTQEKIVKSRAKNIIVSAGAGSGKTSSRTPIFAAMQENAEK